MDWISIKVKTPPRDGSPFLAYCPDQDDVSKIYVLIYKPATSWRKEGYIEAGGECWFNFVPTHWMTLPTPPKD